jgi:hypothetical protein
VNALSARRFDGPRDLTGTSVSRAGFVLPYGVANDVKLKARPAFELEDRLIASNGPVAERAKFAGAAGTAPHALGKDARQHPCIDALPGDVHQIRFRQMSDGHGNGLLCARHNNTETQT